MIDNKTVLVTGGTGSFGQKFIEFLLRNYNPKKIICFSRDEAKQYEMSNKEIFKKNSKILRFFIGDIRDYKRLLFAMEGSDIVIHAAALKQVSIGEYNPFEVIKTNVIGAQNVIDACLASKVKKIIALSTDKAVSPINLYGATKLCSDKLFVSANFYAGKKDIKFSIVRYGNVMGSRGSVIPFFLEIKEKILPVTDKRMTRFNITLDEGVKFVLHSLKIMKGGEIFIPKIPSFNILDLANSISPNSKIKVVGIRPGEKLHEEMITKSDSMTTYEFNDFFVILPHQIFFSKKKINFLSSYKLKYKKCPEGFSYSSDKNSNFLTHQEIKKLIFKNLPLQH